jgi:hypothetical protein
MRVFFFFIFSFISLPLFAQEGALLQEYVDGRLIKEITKKGITVSSSLRAVQRSDGKYYTFDVAVINGGDKKITLLTNKISAKIFKGNKSIQIAALTRKDYLKKKERRQNLRMGLMAVSGAMAASNAGRSTSTTTTNSYGNVSGQVKTDYNIYGSNGTSVYGNSNTNVTGRYSGTSYSTTNSYNGAAAYNAAQNEAAKIERLAQLSSEAKSRWNEEYLKNNTLDILESTSGLINVQYYKSDRLELLVAIDGILFVFPWNPNESEF